MGRTKYMPLLQKGDRDRERWNCAYEWHLFESAGLFRLVLARKFAPTCKEMGRNDMAGEETQGIYEADYSWILDAVS